MSIVSKPMVMSFLRWSLGLVVLGEACRLAVSTTAIHHLQGMGLPAWIAPVRCGFPPGRSIRLPFISLRGFPILEPGR